MTKIVSKSVAPSFLIICDLCIYLCHDLSHFRVTQTVTKIAGLCPTARLVRVRLCTELCHELSHFSENYDSAG